jgi:23S rRNA pseudouridine2605 synthase
MKDEKRSGNRKRVPMGEKVADAYKRRGMGDRRNQTEGESFGGREWSESRPARKTSGFGQGEEPARTFTKKKDFQGGDDRPARSEFSRGGKPFRNRDEQGGDRPFRSRDDSRGDKPFLNREDDRPAYEGSKFGKKKKYNDDASAPSRKPKKWLKSGVAQTPNYSSKVFTKSKSKGQEDLTRLNKFLSNAGICSRREADTLIARGDVKVNGQVVTEMGYKVKPTDKVSFKDKPLKKEKLVYVLLNKPKGFITTLEDERDRSTVMELVANACEERIYPVGRLDRDTTGLLLFTNDGELAKKLSHPSGKTQKIYIVELDKPLEEAHMDQIINRQVVLEDGPVDLDGFSVVSEDMKRIGVELHSGRNRIVRRLFEHFGYEVVKLDRTVFAGLTKIDLPRGKWRFLTEREVVTLKHFLR